MGVLTAVSVLVGVVVVVGGVQGWQQRAALNDCVSPGNREALLAITGFRYQAEFEEGFEAFVGFPPEPEAILSGSSSPEQLARASRFMDAWSYLMGETAVESCYERHCRLSPSIDGVGGNAWSLFPSGKAKCGDKRPSVEQTTEEFRQRLLVDEQ